MSVKCVKVNVCIGNHKERYKWEAERYDLKAAFERDGSEVMCVCVLQCLDTHE